VKAQRVKIYCKNLKHIILNYIRVYPILLRCYAYPFWADKYSPTFRSKFIPLSRGPTERQPELLLVASAGM
jgi:hypothetical protein